MGFLGRMKSALFGGQVESPHRLMQGLFQTGQPPRRGSKEMLEAYQRLPWLHAAVRKIATDVGGIEWKLYAPATKRQEKARRLRRWKREAGETSGEDTLAEVERHPFLDVLRNPNPVLGALGTFFLAQAFQEVKGDAPVIIERAGDGKPLELWPVPPTWLQSGPTAGDPNWRFSFAGWYANVLGPDVLLMRSPDLSNPYGRGVGVGDALADELDIDEFAAQHIKSWFFNRALPDAFIQMEGVTSVKEAERFEEKIRAKHQGVGRGGQIHITPGKLDVKVISQTFREQQLAEVRGQQRDTVLQVYGIPPEVMGIIENSNRATIDAAYFLYSKSVLTPRLNAMAGWLTTLAREWDSRLVVGYANPVPEDREFALKVMTSQPALFSKNEWRCIAGEDPIDGWDEQYPSGFGSTVATDGTATTEDGGAIEQPEAGIEDQLALPGGTVKAQDTALNGAQISSAVEIVAAVASGQLPRDAGLGMLEEFLYMQPDEAMRAMASVGAGFEPTVPVQPAPAPLALTEGSKSEPGRLLPLRKYQGTDGR